VAQDRQLDERFYSHGTSVVAAPPSERERLIEENAEQAEIEVLGDLELQRVGEVRRFHLIGDVNLLMRHRLLAKEVDRVDLQPEAAVSIVGNADAEDDSTV
jgi:hypothetical protein